MVIVLVVSTCPQVGVSEDGTRHGGQAASTAAAWPPSQLLGVLGGGAGWEAVCSGVLAKRAELCACVLRKHPWDASVLCSPRYR